jgi:hypothetical protein
LAHRDSKLEELRRKTEEEAENRAADVWLRLRINEDNAKRIARRQEWEKQQTLKKMGEKTSAVEQANSIKQAEFEMRRKKNEMALQKKKEVAAEFAALVEAGAEPDIEKIAKRFGLDLQVLTRKITESERASKWRKNSPKQDDENEG